MKRNIFWGAALIVIGLILLGAKNDWFNLEITIREVAKFWPLMLVAAGIAVIFHPNRTIYNPVTALLIAFAIPLGIYNSSTNAINDFKDKFDDDINFDFGDDNDNDSLKSEKFNQNFSVPLENGVDEAKFDFGGGAAEFHLAELTDGNLFSADTKGFGSKFNLEHEKINNTQEIVFNMDSKGKSNRFNLKKGLSNDIFLKLNTKPTWDLDLKLGAGNLNFDLSHYKIKSLNVETGAASVDLKMGSLFKETSIKIESGVASVTIRIPKSVGCDIEMDGALNDKNFDGFNKIDDDNFKTENYSSAVNKIHIKVDSGLSSVTVERY